MAEEVRVAVALSKSSRDPEAVKRVLEIAESLGLTNSATGILTITFSATKELCKTLFGQEVTLQPAQPSADAEDGPRDFGSPTGFTVEEPLRVPEALIDSVDAISIEPPVRRLLNAAAKRRIEKGSKKGSRFDLIS